jgi:hypothetical protein
MRIVVSSLAKPDHCPDFSYQTSSEPMLHLYARIHAYPPVIIKAEAPPAPDLRKNGDGAFGADTIALAPPRSGKKGPG